MARPRQLSSDARLPEIIDGWLFHLGATKPSPGASTLTALQCSTSNT